MCRAAQVITIPSKNTTRLRTFPAQQLDHRRKFAHNIPLILLILSYKLTTITKTELEKELKKVKKELSTRITQDDMMELFSVVLKKAGIETLKEMEKITKENLEKSKTAMEVLNA